MEPPPQNDKQKHKRKDDKQNDDCAPRCTICLECRASRPTCTLRCGHTFHTNCAIDWFRSGNDGCPLCRSGDYRRMDPATVHTRAKFLRAHARRKNAPETLKARVLNIRKKEKAGQKAWRDARTYLDRHRTTIEKYKRKLSRYYRTKESILRDTETLGRMHFENVDVPIVVVDY